MAVASALIGGIIGFLSGVSALLIFQTNLFTAMTWYLCIGTGTTIVLIAASLLYGFALKAMARRYAFGKPPIQIIEARSRMRAGPF